MRNGLKNFGLNWYRRIFVAQSVHFYALLTTGLLLVVIGLAMVMSASTVDSINSNDNAYLSFLKQTLFAILGLLGMLIASVLSMRFWRRFAFLFLLFALGLQVIALAFGVSSGGNTNWLQIGSFNIQPSEIIKLALILALAGLVVAYDFEYNPPRRFQFPFWSLSAISMGLILAGRDLGTVLIFAIFLIGMLIQAKLVRYEWNRVFAIGFGALALYLLLFPTNRVARFGNWWKWFTTGEIENTDSNWQFLHGTWAIAEGGLFGVGFGKSKLKWNWIPAAENDFIFAIIAEETGFIGALVVIGLILMLGYFMRNVWLRTQDPFSRLVASGITVWLIAQAMVNISVVLGNLPVLGVPLPFISYGGSSMIMSMIALGVLLAIERDTHQANGSPVLRGANIATLIHAIRYKL